MLVGIAVGLKAGRGVNVAVRVGVLGIIGIDCVGREGVGGRFAHAARPWKYKIDIPRNRVLRKTLAGILPFIVP